MSTSKEERKEKGNIKMQQYIQNNKSNKQTEGIKNYAACKSQNEILLSIKNLNEMKVYFLDIIP